MKRILQIFQLILVFLTPTVFVYLKIISKENDPLLSLTNKIFVLLSAMWSSYLVIELIRRGQNEDIKTGLIKRYRQLLVTNNFFLWVSNIILSLSFFLLCYQIFFFRPVEFISNKNIELYESNSEGQITKIGDLQQEKITTYRIQVGQKYFLFKTPMDSDFSAVEPIFIPFIWKEKNIDRIKLFADEKYEILN